MKRLHDTIPTHTHMHTHTYTYTCAHTRTHTYTLTHTHTHTHTHTVGLIDIASDTVCTYIFDLTGETVSLKRHTALVCVCVCLSHSPHSRSTAGQALSAIDQLLIILLCNYYNGNPSPSPCKILPHLCLQWNLSIKDTIKKAINKGHLSNEGTVCCPNHVGLCTNLPLNKGHLSIQDSQLGPMVSSIERFHCIQDSQLGPNGVLYREVPLYTGQSAGSQWCPL